ncbi:MAG: 8-oxoguanine deaminase [Elusimicrobia bacterium GWA2_62_23]|nr:MAG: 8-oxoguanine deaminase [Elusimicrobia bacterium GWA2_62_23]
MKPKTLLVKNALVLATMDDAGREIAGGDVYIEGPEIKKVGKGLKVKADTVIDAKGCVVLPGMVNTHHHLYQTLTRNLPKVQDAELFDWLVYLYDIWKHVNPEAIYASTQLGLGELLLTGCTTSSDHLYLFPKKDSGFFIDTQIAAAREIGMRFTATRGSMSRGRSKGGLPPDSVVQSEDFILKDCERLINKFHGREKFAMTHVAMAPCSPFSVTTELLKLTAEMAKKWDVRMHTHLAETKDEEAFCEKLFKMRPLEYMESVGWVDEGNAWFAHCVYINEAEAKRMGHTHTGVAHCPCSNLRLGSGIAPVPMFLRHNVPVGLGVDGSASNDSCDMLGEARQCMLVHRLENVKAMPARKAFELATRGGAAVLGRKDIGSIEPGKAADLAIFDVSGLEFAGSKSDPLASLLFCGVSHRTKYTVVNGRVVVRNGRLVNVDEFKLAERANKAAAALYRKAGV